jgi:hypothetical protein
LMPLTKAAGVLFAAAREHVRQIISEHLMNLTMPDGVRLRLGRALEGKSPGFPGKDHQPRVADPVGPSRPDSR